MMNNEQTPQLTIPRVTGCTGINVLSLFDGMSCGQIALERAGIKVNKYFASEIKPHAIKVTQHNYPNTIQLGDVREIKVKSLCLSEVYSYICNYDSNLQSNISEWEVLYWLNKNFTFSAKIRTQKPNERQEVSEPSIIQRIEEVWFSNREMGSVRKFGDDTRSGGNGKENDIRVPQQLQCSEWRYDNDIYRRYKEENIGIAIREAKNGDSEKKNFGNIEEAVFKGRESENYFGENEKSNVEEGCSGELLEREGEDRFSRTVREEKRNGRAEKNIFIDEIVRELCGWNETDGIAQDYWNILRLHKEEQVTVVEHEGGYHIFKGKIDLLCGGSPCQDFSGANKEKLGLQGEKSGLFYEYLRLLKECEPKYFLLENVAMDDYSYAAISEMLGTYPTNINSELVSGQLRQRSYWTNIGPESFDLFGNRYSMIPQPRDKKIKFQDLLDNGYTDRLKARCLLESESRNPGSTFSSLRRYMIQGYINVIFKDKETFEKYSKMTEDEMKANFIDGDIRKLNQNEMERLQTVPNGYTSILKRNEAACLLGDGWTVDIIAHILGYAQW